MRRIFFSALVAASLAGAFALGRLTAPAGAQRQGPAPGVAAPAATDPAAGAGAAAPALASSGAAGQGGEAPRQHRAEAAGGPAAQPPAAAAAPAACPQELAALRDTVAAEARQRREQEGAPIKAPADAPERFSSPAVTAAVTLAFRQTKVPGRIETVDCAEYPCIVYGRIFGEEEQLDRLERARALLPYRGDLQVALIWTTTDEALRRAGADNGERALFAIAFYSKQDRERYGFDLDRRIRVRAADLWNALRPDDEG